MDTFLSRRGGLHLPQRPCGHAFVLSSTDRPCRIVKQQFDVAPFVHGGVGNAPRWTHSVQISPLQQFEHRLGCPLPQDYADFLSRHDDRLLELPLSVPVAGFGGPILICELLPVSELLANDRKECSGRPEGLLYIGNDLGDLDLYMRVTDSEFGRIFIAAAYTSDINPVAESFSDFLAISTPQPDE